MLSVPTAQRTHTVITNTPLLCSAPAAWSSPSDQRSSAQAPVSMSSLQGLADSLIQPLEHH